MRLRDPVAGLDWSFDPAAGTLKFGSRYTWSVQFLGTEAAASNTWLWAWGNPSCAGYPRLLGAARALQRLGRLFRLP